MNLLGLKPEVSWGKRAELLLLVKIPIFPGLRNVMLNCFSSNVSNRTEEFFKTSKVSFAKMSLQPRMLAKKFKGRNSLKQL